MMARYISRKRWGTRSSHSVTVRKPAGGPQIHAMIATARGKDYQGFVGYSWDLVFLDTGPFDELVFTFSDPNAAVAFKLRWA